MIRNSSCSGILVVAKFDETRTSHPVFSRTCSSVHPGFISRARTINKSRRRDEVDAFRKRSLALWGNNKNSLCMNRDFTRATTAGQSHLWLSIVTNNGCVEIAETINLRALQEAHINETALEVVSEYVEHRTHAQRVCNE